MRGFNVHHFLMVAGTAVVGVALFNTFASSRVGGKVPGVKTLSKATGGR